MWRVVLLSLHVSFDFFVTPWTIVHLCPSNYSARILEWVAISFSRGSSWTLKVQIGICLISETTSTCKSQINLHVSQRNWENREVKLQLWKVSISEEDLKNRVLSSPFYGAEILLEGDASAAAAKSLQSCSTLCDPIDDSPPLHRPWNSPGKNTGVGCHFFLQLEGDWDKNL